MAAENVWASGKVLVVYYSLSGNTARVARDLARRAQADVESLQDLEHGVGFFGYVKAALDAFRGKSATLGNLTSDPRRYSLVIIGTPVWVGRMTPAVRAYLTRFSRDLPRVGLFVTSGNTDVGTIAPAIEQVLGHKAEALAGFSARELADQRAYDAKLSGFLGSLNLTPVMRTRESGSACCP